MGNTAPFTFLHIRLVPRLEDVLVMTDLDEFLGIKVKGYHIRPRVGGLCTRDKSEGHITSYITDWSPSTNVAQAFECLNFTSMVYSIDRYSLYVVSIYRADGLATQSDDEKLELAITQAAGRFLGYQE